jgi:hypothetical protein
VEGGPLSTHELPSATMQSAFAAEVQLVQSFPAAMKPGLQLYVMLRFGVLPPPASLEKKRWAAVVALPSVLLVICQPKLLLGVSIQLCTSLIIPALVGRLESQVMGTSIKAGAEA